MVVERALQRRASWVVPLLAAATWACGAAPLKPSTARAGVTYPTPCHVDPVKGEPDEKGTLVAMCCPKGYAAAENMESNVCPAGFCCDYGDDMHAPVPFPSDPRVQGPTPF